MIHNMEGTLQKLANGIRTLPGILSIGISGSMETIPKAGEGDIDIFIYCEKIPEVKDRELLLANLDDLIQEGKVGVFSGGHWGTGDFGSLNGVETWFMYFTVEETLKDIESILKGECPGKLDNYYYPIGRCAMLQSINILYDRGDTLGSIKNKLLVYPERLSDILVKYHMEELLDTEDLERAVIRKDVLFYHFALDLALDHFLQCLFALNKVYFPSRKRTLMYIDSFRLKPEDCARRILEAVKLGGSVESIGESYSLFINLADETRVLVNRLLT